jgi:hypothetical protein
MILVMFQGKGCGAREAELQGASSVHAGGAMGMIKMTRDDQDDT